jgi:hypothetical protein
LRRTHEFGPDYQPDEAARAFRSVVTQFQSKYRERLAQVIDDYLFGMDQNYRDGATHAGALARVAALR